MTDGEDVARRRKKNIFKKEMREVSSDLFYNPLSLGQDVSQRANY